MSEIFPFTAGEGLLFTEKVIWNGWFVDRHPWQRDGIIGVGDGIPDVYFFQATEGDDFAGFSRSISVRSSPENTARSEIFPGTWSPSFVRVTTFCRRAIEPD